MDQNQINLLTVLSAEVEDALTEIVADARFAALKAKIKVKVTEDTLPDGTKANPRMSASLSVKP